MSMSLEPAPPRRRTSSGSKLLLGFLVGVLVAAVVIPNHESTTPPGVAALEAANAGSGDAPAAGAPAPAAAAATAPASGAAPAASSSAAPAASAPAATPAGGTRSTQSAAAAAPVDNTKLPNGGATARGVTATEIKIGVVDLDSSGLSPVCPRCGNGPSKDGGAELGLIQAWTRDGLLPVNGRTLKPTFRIAGAVSPEEARNACVAMAQEVKPFIVVVGPGLGAGVAQCLASEFKLPAINGDGSVDDAVVEQVYPLIHLVGPSYGRALRNFVQWSESNNLLKGQKIGLYSMDNDAYQDIVTRSFREVLKQKGYSLAADVVGGNGTEAVAVQQFRAAGVTVAFILQGLGSGLAFQQAAEGQGYRPKYPVVDAGYNMTDAVADIQAQPDAMDGNLGMGLKWWSWSARRPLAPVGNKTAAYCLKSYQDYTKRQLDVWDNDAEIRYVLDVCSDMEVMRAALAAAGPNLTYERFVAGLHTLKGFETSEYVSTSFRPGKYSGSDYFATATHKKARWQPENDYWRVTGPWTPFYTE